MNKVQTLIDGTDLTQHLATTKVYRDPQGRLRIETAMGIVPPLYRTPADRVQEGPIPLKEALGFAKQVCRGSRSGARQKHRSSRSEADQRHDQPGRSVKCWISGWRPQVLPLLKRVSMNRDSWGEI